MGDLSARIPNEEVRQVFEKRIQKRFSPRNKDFALLCERFAQAAESGDAAVMRSGMMKVLIRYVSVRDAATRARAEIYYHGFLLALLAGAGDAVDGLRSNAEAGDGCADLMFTSADLDTGVVLELKRSSKDSDMEADAGRALRQIEDKHYVRGLLGRGCRRFYGYGIAFSGKSCFVMGKPLAGKELAKRRKEGCRREYSGILQKEQSPAGLEPPPCRAAFSCRRGHYFVSSSFRHFTKVLGSFRLP